MTKIFSQLLLVQLVLLYFVQKCRVSCQIQAHKFVSGFYEEELPLPILYDSYIPIIYEYQLPVWNKSDITFNNWYHCQSELLPYKSCAVMFNLNKAITNLHIDFESLQPVQDFVEHSAYYGKLFQTLTFCEKIQPHFSGIFLQKSELANYLDALKSCLATSGYDENLGHIELSINDFNYSITAPYNRIEMNFYEVFYKAINATSELIATSALSNSRSTIQANLLGSYYAEKYRWVHALQDCQQQLLPHSLVTLRKLNETLTEMSSKLSSSSYEFAIPLELMSKYYSLPLTDCTYTKDSFVVRLLFPIRAKSISYEDNYSLLRFQPVPFRYQNKFCAGKISWSEHQNILYDSQSKLAYSTPCKSNALCQLPENPGNSINTCATAILTANIAETQSACQFECEESATEQILVTKVGSNKYILTIPQLNNAKTPTRGTSRIFTNCDNGILINESINSSGNGAHEITLPCKCQLMLVGDDRKYYSRIPCNNASSPVIIVQIEPWHFVRKTGADADAENLEMDPELIQMYLENRKSSSSPFSLSQEYDGSNNNHENPMNSSSLTFLWCSFLITSLVLLTIQIFILYKLRLISHSSSYYPQRNEGRSSQQASSEEPKTLDNLLYYSVAGSRNNDSESEPQVQLVTNAY